jgi:hypothetical protein
MKRSTAALHLAILALAACSTKEPSDSPTSKNDLGTGVNTVSRKYAKPAAEVWDAAAGAAKSYDFTIDSDRHDKMGGELVAHRANGDRVDIKVRSLDAQDSEAAVRVEPGNRNMANLIHEKIAEKVGLGTSKAGVFGDYSIDGTYTADLQRCTAAAEAACKKLTLEVTNKELREKSAVVDARESNSNPVRIQMSRSGDTQTKVTFSARDSNGSDPRALTSRLKAEFDRQIAAVAQ